MLYFVEQNKIKGEFSARKGTLHPIMIKGTLNQQTPDGFPAAYTDQLCAYSVNP